MKKILIIRFSSIGDIVLTTPVIRCLKNAYGDKVQIQYLTKRQFVPLLSPNPYLSKIHQFSKSTNEVITDLKKENFDLIIDLHKNLRSRLLKLKLGKKSYSFNKLNFRKWILVNLGINLLPKRNIVDRYMDSINKLRIKNDGLGLDFFIPQEKEDALKILPEQFLTNGYIAIAPGGTYKGKRLTKEMLLLICENTNRNILLVGGKTEKEFGSFLIDNNCTNIFDACGSTDLLESAVLIKNAILVICTDTGFMHIASAFKKKIISLWGCTTPSLGMYPYLPNPKSVMIEPINRKKRPCSKLGNRCKYGDFECIKSIELQQILVAINSII